MKNNKGFTLVELLAVAVILGILSVFSIPLISDMVEKNRNKMFISDAKKLISQAEYKLRANSSVIQKPTTGNCIIMSLSYFDTSEFGTPPFDGEYIKDSSFVVIKNNNGDFKYAATIVEKIKDGGYKGIDLSSNEDLISGDALKNVKKFEVTTLPKASTITASGTGMCNAISKRYQ